MAHGYHCPGPGTSAYLRTILSWRARTGELDWPVLPVGLSAFVALYGPGDRQSQHCRFWLQSRSLSARDIEAHADGFLVTAVFFRPFMAAPVFGVPVERLMQGPVPLDEVDPDAVNWLADRSLAMTAPQDTVEAGMRELIESYLLRRIHRNRVLCDIIRQAVEMILADPDPQTLRDIKHRFRVGDRRLQRLFSTYVGLSPNRFRRLCQFQQSFQQLQHGDVEDLTELAFEAGYADQSHFNRTFREFTGCSPGDYLRYGLDNVPRDRRPCSLHNR